VLLDRAASDIGVGSRTEAPRGLAADIELDLSADINSVCASVFTAMNSTPRRPPSIMRLTAFTPPPPIPTTLMTAR
jgi:hypothetical protein